MAGMRASRLFGLGSLGILKLLLPAIGCPSSQIATDKSAAVPLWKVIVGSRADELKPGPQGSGFSMTLCRRHFAQVEVIIRLRIGYLLSDTSAPCPKFVKHLGTL
jgi:hypothetical protein